MPAKKTTSPKKTTAKKAEEKVTKKAAPKKVAEKAAKETSPKKVVEKSPEIKKDNRKYDYANGKRKTSVARVRLYENGKGEITINGKSIEDFCTVHLHKEVIKSPLKLTGHLQTFDISIKVIGGGPTGQVEAARHGIAKALVEFDIELRPTLKKAGMLTRDSRMKERKKFGLKRARRAPQWAKR